MKSLLLAGVALALLSQSTFAAAPKLGGIVGRLLAADWTSSASIDDDLFKVISFKAAEGEAFTLESSKLSDVATTFGGKIQATEAYGGSVSWLCYDSADGKRTWFVSAELGDDKAPLLTMIAEETIGKNTPDAQCSKVAAALIPVPGDKLPGLDAKLADLAKRFGGADPDDKGRVSFMSSAPGTGDIVQSKNIYYLLAKDDVVAVAFSAVSEE